MLGRLLIMLFLLLSSKLRLDAFRVRRLGRSIMTSPCHFMLGQTNMPLQFRSTSTSLCQSSLAEMHEKWEAARDGKTLVIVESPAKAKTIQKFLPEDKFVIDYSAGHIRDLPSKLEKAPPELRKEIITDVINLNVAHLGIHVHNNFEPIYVTMTKKAEVVKRLKKLSKECSRIILATDEDREGEAISWHLVELLQPSVPYRRAVFHEITKQAIIDSFENPRDIDMDLVQSQETRRVLDRLAGFTVSPVLWRYVAPGISAGRVQSCGLNIIAQREKKRWAFIESSYFTIKGDFHIESESVDPVSVRFPAAALKTVNGRKVATESDFDGETGDLASGKSAENTVVLDPEMASVLMSRLTSSPNTQQFVVDSIEEKKSTRKAPLPFITSTLQQAGSSRLSLSPSETMRIAQELYEEGYITYMRTDSPILSTQAKEIATKLVIDNFGSEYLQDGGGRKDGHSRKDKKAPLNAQEAHEAIRPVEWSGTFKTPEETGLDGKKKALYSLVYKRCIASMMTKAELLTKTYSISNGNDSHEDQVVFKTSETDTLFPGFQAGIDMLDDGTRNHVAEANKQKFGKKERVTQGQRVWLTNAIQNTDSMGTNDALAAPETGDEDEDDGDNDNDDVAIVIEEDQKDQKDILLMEGLTGVPHKTRPPSRFSESSFIKELEKMGVGRPSTYSKVIETLRSAERGYVLVDRHSIVPTITGLVVSDFLEEHFPDLTQAEFTASMEDSLDKIAQGKQNKVDFLTSYYLGPEEQATHRHHHHHDKSDVGLLKQVESKLLNSQIDHSSSRELHIPVIAHLGKIRIGSSGAYFEDHEKGSRWKLPEAMQQDIREISAESIEQLMASEITTDGFSLGKDADGNPIVIRSGRYGKFLQIGEDDDKKKTYHSLPKWLDVATITFDQALEFAQTPYRLCLHPDPKLARPVTTGDFSSTDNGGLVVDDDQSVQPYIIADVTSGSVSLGVEGYPLRVPAPEGLFPSQIDHSLAMELLVDVDAIMDSQRLLGVHEGEEVKILKGRFGHYVRWGKMIAGLRKAVPSEVTLEEAIDMIKTRGKELGSKRRGKGAKGATKKGSTGKVKKKTAVTTKRAASAYQNFCKQKREEVKEANPNISFGEMGKTLGKLWAALSQAEKDTYRSEQADDGEIANLMEGAKNQTSERAAKKDKRPPSPFINFCRVKRPEVKSQGSGDQGEELSFGEISKRLSSMWKDLSDSEKERYRVDENVSS